MERGRGRRIRALSVDKDWCGSEQDGAVGGDWCGQDADGIVTDGRRGDWCGTDRQSPDLDDVGALLARFSLRRQRS